MSNVILDKNPKPKSFVNQLDSFIRLIANRFGDKSKEVERFIKFGIVGLIGAFVDFGTLFILQATLLPPTNAIGEELQINVTIASILAFTAAILSNFTWNRLWTYPDSRSNSAKQQLVQFTLISAIGGISRTLWISFSYLPIGEAVMPIVSPRLRSFSNFFEPTPDNTARLGTMIALLIGIIVVMFWNFFANRYWTYNDVE